MGGFEVTLIVVFVNLVNHGMGPITGWLTGERS